MRTTSTLANQGGPVGGVRRRDENRGQFYDRMDSRKMAGGMTTPAPMPFTGRQANIAKARADGTFDAKRNAFNAANTGSYMDEQGNIGPKAPPLPGTSSAQGPFTQSQKFASAPAGGASTTPTPRATGTTPGFTPVAGGEVNSKGQVRATAPASAFTSAPFTSMPPGSRNLAAEEKSRQKGAFTSMPPGSRDLYAEEKARNVQLQVAASPDPQKQQFAALGKAASIANSPETKAVMAKAKTILAKKPFSAPAVASATPKVNAAALDTIKAANPFSSMPTQPQAPKAPATQLKPVAASAEGSIPPIPPKPASGFIEKRIAANPDGIFGKAADVASKVSRGVTNAAKTVTPVATKFAANVFNTAVANPAAAIRSGIIERGKKSPFGAMANLSKKLPKARPFTSGLTSK